MSTELVMPKYPIFIPSTGRAKTPFTARMLHQDGVPFIFVVQESEAEDYAAVAGPECVLTHDLGKVMLLDVRNWIKDYSKAQGHERHWQLDDNMTQFTRTFYGRRIRCPANGALCAMEDFTDRYSNIAISGPNYDFFNKGKIPPFYLNGRVYSCSLINNAIQSRWRVFNDDIDMCLQVLCEGWCTVLFNVISVHKLRTMKVKGGNTTSYVQNDGRLKFARSLVRIWPYVAKLGRRFKRPQHVVPNMNHFDTQLKLKPGVDLTKLPRTCDYGMQLVKRTKKNKVNEPKEQRYRRQRIKTRAGY